MVWVDEGGTRPGVLGDGDSLFERFARIRHEQQLLLSELRAGDRRLRALARRVWRVEEEERRRLARELHDGVGQALTALKNELGRLAAKPKGATAEEWRAAIELAAEALAETRELSRLLRPAILDDLGLEPALRALARQLGERAGFRVDIAIEGELGGLPREMETLLFRVAQEGLNNALKHSGGTGATLEVKRAREQVTLAVRDTGCGCEPAQALRASEEQTGIGLHSVQDRVALFGGEMRFESVPGTGTKLSVAVPLEEEESV